MTDTSHWVRVPETTNEIGMLEPDMDLSLLEGYVAVQPHPDGAPLYICRIWLKEGVDLEEFLEPDMTELNDTPVQAINQLRGRDMSEDEIQTAYRVWTRDIQGEDVDDGA